jgi:hypothetical protein
MAEIDVVEVISVIEHTWHFCFHLKYFLHIHLVLPLPPYVLFLGVSMSLLHLPCICWCINVLSLVLQRISLLGDVTQGLKWYVDMKDLQIHNTSCSLSQWDGAGISTYVLGTSTCMPNTHLQTFKAEEVFPPLHTNTHTHTQHTNSIHHCLPYIRVSDLNLTNIRVLLNSIPHSSFIIIFTSIILCIQSSHNSELYSYSQFSPSTLL